MKKSDVEKENLARLCDRIDEEINLMGDVYTVAEVAEKVLLSYEADEDV